MSHISVNHWIKRFKSVGISGLKNKPGQGRKAVLDTNALKASPMQHIIIIRLR